MSEQTDDNRSDHDDERDNENDNDNDDELFSDVEVDKLPPAEQARALERAQAAKAEGNDKYQRKEYDEAIDCYSKALDLTLPTDFKDYKKVAEHEPQNIQASSACERLPALVALQREKEKEEMLNKLKDLGNTVLGKFGMSLDNFQAVKDPVTGSYSVNFKPK